ncbi:hypothetical protein D3C75_400050 [compost metagenome]
MPSTEDFKREINRRIEEAREIGAGHVDIVSRSVHKKLGGYPAFNGRHRMHSCCNAMRALMKSGDVQIEGPEKGNGATLKIRYYT